MTITESIKFDKLQEENELLKKELAEKNKEIKKLKNDFIPLYEWVESQTDYLEELKQHQLFKEDFNTIWIDYIYWYGEDCENWEESSCDCSVEIVYLKDSSKYEKLESKEDKTCI